MDDLTRRKLHDTMNSLAMTAATIRTLTSQVQYAVNGKDAQTVRDLGQAVLPYLDEFRELFTVKFLAQMNDPSPEMKSCNETARVRMVVAEPLAERSSL